MTTGTVKWFNAQKSVGSIALDDGRHDAFVHISVVERAGIVSVQDDPKVGVERPSDRKSGKMAAKKLTILG